MSKDKIAAWFCRIPGWLWRLIFSASLGGVTLAILVPWAQAQRGYPAIGGEHMVVFVVSMLPLLHLPPLRTHQRK